MVKKVINNSYFKNYIYYFLPITLLIILFFIIFFCNTKNEYFDNKNNEVNIVLSCDQNQFPGLIAVVNSICTHTNSLSRIKFYLLIDKNEKKILTKMLNKLIKEKNYNFHFFIKEIRYDKQILDNIRVINNHNIKNIMNFSRFNFADEFPLCDKILYIDADMIVKDDIVKLYDSCNTNIKPFYAVPMYGGQPSLLRSYGDINVEDLKKNNIPINKNRKYFNAGIFITSLNYWRSHKIKDKFINFMILHKKLKNGLFKLGTQPIMNLCFQDYGELDKRWNVKDLGYKNVDANLIKTAGVLHWNGPEKPWLEKGRYKELWLPYTISL